MTGAAGRQVRTWLQAFERALSATDIAGGSALFHPGRTSRINTAHCLAAFTDDDKLWNTWKGGMPVIYGA